MSEVTGKDLIEMGFSPAPWFGEALREFGERRLSRSQAARVAQGYVDRIAAAEAARAARERPLHATPPDWRVNITAETEAEQANLDAVLRSFDLLVRTPTVETGAVMPDACPAGPDGTIPVGGVIAARDAIHPGMHSAGIDARFFCGRIDVSELPSAYKSADRVRADMARFGLADVVDEIRPHGAIMAGDWEADAPWRRKGGAA